VNVRLSCIFGARAKDGIRRRFQQDDAFPALRFGWFEGIATGGLRQGGWPSLSTAHRLAGLVLFDGTVLTVPFKTFPEGP
jgi:hypothetical protein